MYDALAVSPRSDGAWDLESAGGIGRLTLKGDAASGVIDHSYVDVDGVSWSVPGRVVAGGGGTVLVLTFTKPAELAPGMGDAKFAQVMRQVDDGLAALKRLLESA